MALFDDDFACPYCLQTFEIQQDWISHLTIVHFGPPAAQSTSQPPPTLPSQLPTPPKSTGGATPDSATPAQQLAASPIPPSRHHQGHGQQQQNSSNAQVAEVLHTHPTVAINPSHTILALPQAVLDLGLTVNDFDPWLPVGDEARVCVATKYVDIPASFNLPDALMFRAHPNIILGYGNLLRLAARHSNDELKKNFNRDRTNYKFHNAAIQRRINSAVKWAAGRPEWAHVGDVQAWLDGERGTKTQGVKRKRDDECAVETTSIAERATTTTTEDDAYKGARYGVPAAMCDEHLPEENFDDVFGEFLMQPETFMNAQEFYLGVTMAPFWAER